ncbi:MAG: JAB domain-containing protein, partial [Bryobacteraceae bacterium]
MYVRELRALYVVRRVPDLPLSPVSLRKTTDVAAIFTSLLGSEPVEVCGLLCLSTTFDVLTYHELSRGSLNGASAHPREVFKAALLANAASVM